MMITDSRVAVGLQDARDAAFLSSFWSPHAYAIQTLSCVSGSSVPSSYVSHFEGAERGWIKSQK